MEEKIYINSLTLQKQQVRMQMLLLQQVKNHQKRKQQKR